jgi:hypothetical protein
LAITIAKRSIQKISIIDDQAPVRESYELTVEDLGLESVSESGPLDDELPNCVHAVSHRADAAICDYNLRVKGGYSKFNGAELTAGFYKVKFPALLCTKWHTAVIDEMRQYRRYIPSLIDPSKLDPASITKGIESCIREFDGDYRAVRRPWRALIRIEDIRKTDGGSEFVFVVVPAWNSNEVVKLPTNLIPPDIFKKLGPGSRLHAKVNLGAVGNEELFFEEWEL